MVNSALVANLGRLNHVCRIRELEDASLLEYNAMFLKI
jgi:hypothetical protein